MADTDTPTTPQAPASTPFFNAWRPLVGWITVMALGLKFLILPVIGTALVLWGKGTDRIPASVNFTDLMTLMGTAIGFGGMRTLEKIKGIVPTK